MRFILYSVHFVTHLSLLKILRFIFFMRHIFNNVFINSVCLFVSHNPFFIYEYILGFNPKNSTIEIPLVSSFILLNIFFVSHIIKSQIIWIFTKSNISNQIKSKLTSTLFLKFSFVFSYTLLFINLKKSFSKLLLGFFRIKVNIWF